MTQLSKKMTPTKEWPVLACFRGEELKVRNVPKTEVNKTAAVCHQIILPLREKWVTETKPTTILQQNESNIENTQSHFTETSRRILQTNFKTNIKSMKLYLKLIKYKLRAR